MADYTARGGPAVVEQRVTEGQHYFRNGLYHRDQPDEDSDPAFERHYIDSGDPAVFIWFKDGLRHREFELPALVEGFDGDLGEERCHAWYRRGKLHREAGPAAIVGEEFKIWAVPTGPGENDFVTLARGEELYALDGERMAKSEWLRQRRR